MFTEISNVVGSAILCVVSLSVILLIPLRALARRRTPETKDWPNVPGMVTVSEKRHGNEHIGKRASTKLRYAYQVDGRSYSGSRIRLMDAGIDLEWAFMHYPVGQTVNVYYDPQNAASAILEPGTEGDYFGRGIIGETLFWISEALLGVAAVLCCWFTYYTIMHG